VLNEVKESILNAYCAKSGLSRTKVSNLMSNETWMNAKKAVELGFADEILFTDKKQEEKPGAKPDEDEDPEQEPEEGEEPDKDGGDGGNGEDEDEKEKKKPFQLHSDLACMYSSRQTVLKVLNAHGVDLSKAPKAELEPKAEPPEPVEEVPPADATPVIGMDGKTKDGAMPYTILMNQLECLR